MRGTGLTRRDALRGIGAAAMAWGPAGNLQAAQPAPAVRQYGARLNYVHFKDAVRPFSRPDFFPNLRDLGKGEVDFPGVMRVLRELRCQGWINVEQDFTATTPGESCRASLEYVKKELDPIYR